MLPPKQKERVAPPGCHTGLTECLEGRLAEGLKRRPGRRRHVRKAMQARSRRAKGGTEALRAKRAACSVVKGHIESTRNHLENTRKDDFEAGSFVWCQIKIITHLNHGIHS